MGLFYLLTLYAAIRAMESPRALGWQLVAFVACLAGMASKEVMVSAPLMVLLYDRTFVAGTFRAAWQRRRWSYVCLAATWIVLAWLVVGMGHGDRGGAGGFTSKLSWWSYLLTQAEGIVRYLKLCLWPHPLVLDYGTYVARNPAVIVPCFSFLAILVVATVAALRRWPVWGFVGVWFFAILAPSSSVLPLATQTLAEHRMYLPLAAVTTLAAAGLHLLLGRRGLLVAAARRADDPPECRLPQRPGHLDRDGGRMSRQRPRPGGNGRRPARRGAPGRSNPILSAGVAA